MNEENTIHSFYDVTPIDFPQGEEYISDIISITMSDTGIIDAQIANMTCNESCMMLINAIKLFQMGFFDCAFYSIRQTIELSLGGLYLYTDNNKIHDWNTGENGFEKGRMTQLLKRNDATFSDVREKLGFYFDELRETELKIDKYVHKQGMSTFYTYYGHSPNYRQKHKEKLIRDFEKYLNDCIGAVAIYRLIVDPLPLLLTDQDIVMRSPDFITLPYGQTFINKYLNEKVIDAYKQTNIYQGYYEELSSHEKQNEAVYNLIHNQYVDRNHIEEYEEQSHLLSVHDKLALIIALASQKITNCYLMNGFLWYFTEVKTYRETNSYNFGNSYYQNLFTDKENYNIPFDNVFVSRCYAFEETHYFEHNEPLLKQEIDIIEQYVSELNNNFKEAEKQLHDFFDSQTSNKVILTNK